MANDPYVTAEELKALLGITGTEYQDAAIELACAAARDVIDGYMGTEFTPTTETRYFTGRIGDLEMTVGDLSSITTLKLDRDADGVYEETLVEGTDFYLDPVNASLDTIPGRVITLRRPGSRRWPRWERSVQINGVFGWTEVPNAVKQASVFLANRWLNRTRSAPFGVLVATTNDAVAMARLGKIDPDVETLLGNIPGRVASGLVAIQLG